MKTPPSVTLVTFLVLGAGAAEAQNGRAALVGKLDSIANSPVVEGRAVGIGVAVVKGKDTLLLKGYGKSDVEWNIAMPADAVFEIGSVTKQFTAAAILQLRDAGKLSLDDDITKFVPDYTPAHKVTLRRLLDHTSGIKGLTEMPEFGPLSVTSWPRDSALALIKRAPFEFAPGEAMIYNNSAFWLLGLVIEKASGMSYEDYVEQKIFAPLGMKRSMYCNSGEVVERRAHGYGYRGRTEVQRAPMNVHTWPYSAGSLCSTAGDMVTWLQALHGGKVVSPASYKEMITPSKLNDGTPLRYSMGLAVGNDVRGIYRIGHGGGIAGFVTEVTWYPDSQLAVVVLMNSTGPISPAALGAELAAEVLPWKRPEPKPFTGDAAPLLGTYKGPSRGREMTVVVAQAPQGITVAVNGQPARPVQWVEGVVFRDANTYITFKPNEVRWDAGGGLYVLKRQP